MGRAASCRAQGDAGDSEGGDGVDTDGLGHSCTLQGEYAGNPVASFCAETPISNEGKCTAADCTVVPDSCPASWIRCDFDTIGDAVFGGRNLCVDQEMKDEISKCQVKCV